ncbi:heparinase II/III family protein [Bdellovibrio bacteriovorus]|uniref:heparinase II/III family protein n=1 Tax=Bdellovibrio bacteriovorus TaxID=959 RepID=UPI0035A8493B
MSFKQYFKRAISLPPHVVFLKMLQLLTFRAKACFLQIRDKFFSTYSQVFQNESPHPLFPTAPETAQITKSFPELPDLLTKMKNHEFDLLGSGWTRIYHGMKAKGLEGHSYSFSPSSPPIPQQTTWIKHVINSSNRKYSAQVWSMIDNEYTPIDWHLDFKSGYRWNENVWWFRIPYGHKPGVDIKVPWEISRSQHLPWFAFGYALSKTSAEAAQYAAEFQNQILDFIATNPPKYGVNWRCAMDVSIRAANWILTYDFFRSYGWTFDTSFNHIFLNSLYDHGDYVFKNLEIGKDGFRGNHYLADICGLAFISAFLPETKSTNIWFEFSHVALAKEMDYQFFDDGANFEGSTAYHRLSAEMMLYTSLLFAHQEDRVTRLGLSNSFEKNYLKKLFSMSTFAKTVTRPDGNITQIGDCDSGRFFKLQPLFEDLGLVETHLNFACLTEALDSLFGKLEKPKLLEALWISSLNANFKDNNFAPTAIVPYIDEVTVTKMLPSDVARVVIKAFEDTNLVLSGLAYPTQTTEFSVPVSLQSTSLFSYKDFGLVGWRSENFYLGFRCGPVGQKNRGGHDHNDQLSLEIFADKTAIIEDPGTAIYTPLPQVRNAYRSVTAHFAPLLTDTKGKIVEPASLDQGLFSLSGNQRSYLLVATNRALVGYNPKLKTIRFVLKNDTIIKIYDVCLDNTWKFSSDRKKLPYSKGYGWF